MHNSTIDNRGYKDYESPTLMLKGKWLEKYGFSVGISYSVSCEEGRLIIEVQEKI